MRMEKIEKFYRSKNWNFYLNACNNMGFMVDRNNPWRLVADIASGEMLEMASNYGLTSTNEILNIAFKKAHRDYFKTFKVIMFNMYTKLKKKRITSLVNVDQSGDRIVVRTPVEYSYQQFIEQHDDIYFLNLYCQLRFVEEESHFSKSEQARMIDNLIELSNTNFVKTIDCFETILNRTFDYHSSLSYISNTLDKTRE